MNTSNQARFSNRSRFTDWLFLFVLCGISFLLGLGRNQLFDWDEINFAESAREMLVSGNYFQVQIDFKPFWEKPPLFFWLQAGCMHLFGVNEMAARLPNAIIGIIVILSLYRFGSQLVNVQFGRLVAGFYVASLLPHLYFKSGIIDPVFNFFIFLGIINLVRFEQVFSKREASSKYIRWTAPLYAGFWLGLATLTKGPVALLIVGLTYFGYACWFFQVRSFLTGVIRMLISYTVVVGSWFGVETYVHGTWFVEKFLHYQIELFTQPVAGHEQPFYYHFIVFLIGCFPMSLFAFRGMFPERLNLETRILKTIMFLWFWVVMIIFSISQTKIVHYSSMTYYPGAFLAAFYVAKLMYENKHPAWEVFLGYIVLILGVSAALITVPYLGMHPELILSRIHDKFISAALSLPLSWSYWDMLAGISFVIIGTIALYFIISKQYEKFVYAFMINTAISLNLVNEYIVPKIAQYTQGPAIQFFREQDSRSELAIPVGYKSYAHYFYGKTTPEKSKLQDNPDFILSEQFQNPVYVSAKVNDREEVMTRFSNLKLWYSSGGYDFYVKPSLAKNKGS
ncbi:MAG: glycosyltransferase family 39 protein [Bacteroidia bacterium]|nr:glycosyltransferase family 39 protein [Bacteroidia bacterium]